MAIAPGAPKSYPALAIRKYIDRTVGLHNVSSYSFEEKASGETLLTLEINVTAEMFDIINI